MSRSGYVDDFEDDDPLVDAQPVINELYHALFMAKRALEESADLVSTEYATDWRHGMPTRAKQLAGMKALVDAHYAAIASAQAALEQKALDRWTPKDKP